MSSILQSTRNTRALPTGEIRYIRSDVPENLSDKEIRWLLKDNLMDMLRKRRRVPRFPVSGIACAGMKIC